jgi:protein Tex
VLAHPMSKRDPAQPAPSTKAGVAPALADYDPVPIVAAELGLPLAGVAAVLRLLSEGATVPFIARYRKEATLGLDEVAIRQIEERCAYLLELHERKCSVLAEIEQQAKLTPDLAAKIRAASTKAELEDLYLPFKPKRRTRATIARARGLLPLADAMWQQLGSASPETQARQFVDAAKEVPDVSAALAGARDICAERIAEHARVRSELRTAFFKAGSIRVSKTKAYREQTTKFDTYARFEEPLANLRSHRFMAIHRGEDEGVLDVDLALDPTPLWPFIERQIGISRRSPSPWTAQLELALGDALKRLLWPSVQGDVRAQLKERSEAEAIAVFAQNLRELLLASPFGAKTVLGIDPGQRTGCKCAMVDATGKLLDFAVIHLVAGESALERARETLRALCKKHGPRAIAVGNGTHGRETESFVRTLLASEGLTQDGVFCVPVSESGASIYSASEIAREEFPDLDVTVRGAISIARRLQDPLAELVKVDPKSVGVGQYQHDVHQPALARKLDEVVESCVSQVGVELNTASAALLGRVAGIGPSVAKKIVAHREARGAFADRSGLLKVPGLGPRAFEQCAGFLRIAGAKHPLDASAVHPERYALVERMARDLGVTVGSLVGNCELVAKIDLERYQDGDVGEYTLRDIALELQKPGRDPRVSFEPPRFRDDVRTLEDLKLDMLLEGVVTNVTAFGAFVDVGVHQDGLVHVSQLADRFVKSPSDVVKVGDRIEVRVLEVDLARRRIALSARKQPAPSTNSSTPAASTPGPPRPQAPPERRGPGRSGAIGGTGGTSSSGGTPGKLSHNPFADRLKR